MRRHAQYTLLVLSSFVLATGTLSGCPGDESDKKDLASFVFRADDNPGLDADVVARIDNGVVSASVPNAVELTHLIPTIEHGGESVTPASGEAQDFSGPVTYTVTAADGSELRFEVRVGRGVRPGSNKAITSFMLAGHSGTIGLTEITVDVPYGTDVSALAPMIEFEGASLSPAPDTVHDFTTRVAYTVTAADGSKRRYEVDVRVAPSSAKEITRFEIDGVRGNIDGTSITLTLPFAAELTKRVPLIEITGKRVEPASNAARDFTGPVEYVVTAADGSTRTYTVSVTRAASDAKALTKLSLLGVQASITGTDVSLTLPWGTDLSALKPSLEHTGASVSPSVDEAQDFSEDVVYTIKAADGSEQAYTVKVQLAANPTKEITHFELLDVEADIQGAAIALTLPHGTQLTSLTPEIVHTGTSIEPAANTARDFSTPQTYLVRAADGSTREYTVSVTVAASSAKAITRFALLNAEAQITGNQITLTLPFGTDPSALTPTIEHEGASVSPASGAAQDFSSPVTYTVTAADGSTRQYSVEISIADSNAKDLTALSINDVPGTISGTSVSVNLPFGTDPRELSAVLTITGASVSPQSGSTQDFRQPVEYTVMADDGSTKTYTVTVNVALNSAKDITGFTIGGTPATISGSSISLTLPYGTDRSSLTPSITITGQSVSPNSGAAQSFTSPVTYTVTAQNGTTKQYTVNVSVALNSAKDITAFSIGGVPATISGTTISLTVPFGTDLASLTPSVTITGQSLNPASGVTRNFAGPVFYTVTAENGTTKQYTVNVTNALNSAKDITAFSIGGVPATISGSNISLTTPFGTDRSSLTPSISITGQSVSPNTGVTQDFSNPVTYTVTADNGTTKQYTVTVTNALNSSKDITSFSIGGSPATISGTNISLTTPYGTDRSSLTPSISITGQSVSPNTGVAQNFTNPVTYTVTADNGTTKQYTVTVTNALNSAKDITAFSITGLPATISGTSISLTTPFGTDRSSLTPSISITGQSVSPNTGVAQSFTGPVTYTVTAENGTTKQYTVTVTNALNSSKDITAFSIGGTPATISGTSISLTTPYGTDRSSLTPSISITGQSVSPNTGVAQDFSNPVTYTVTAENGTTKQYSVTVTNALNSSKDITAFSIGGTPATISGTNISLTTPYGTDRSSLTPSITITGQSVSPNTGVTQDFSNPVTYTVTADNGTTKQYTVTVSNALNSAKDITAFSIGGTPATISGTNISLTTPYGTDRSSLTPSITITGEGVSPDTGVPQDFTNPVTYTVTAENNTTKQYTVTITNALNSAKDITAFSIGGVPATISGTSITLTTPYGTDRSSLTPSITITGQSVGPNTGVAQDFSNPVTYTVTAENGTTKQYTVTITNALNSAKDITAFSIGGVPATISGTNISLTTPYGTDRSSLTPSITITGASVNPNTAVAQDFSNPVIYTVTAENSTTKQYTVTVTNALNSAKDITAFSIGGVPATISGTNISLTTPYGTDRSSLTPSITITGQSVSPNTGVAQDFSNPVTYTVTAENGTTKQYTITITNALNSAKDITAFSIGGVPATISGTSIGLTTPYGTDRSSLTPSITITGQSVSPDTGVPQNFTSAVTYTVTAENGTTKQYTVNVSNALNSAKDITAFSIGGVPATISGTTISLTTPYGTDRSSLTPAITITGQSVSPNTAVAQDFTNPVTYTVTAENGTTKQYTVNVTNALNNAKDITAFSINGSPATISGTSISLTTPYGTDRSSLTPSITITGQSVSPNTGVAQDFTNPVTYTVTAENGNTQQYTVTVTNALNSAKDITAFSISGTVGTISGTNITVTMPYGTDRSSLTPSITHTGQTLSPNTGVARNFTSPVTYTVTAQDGTTQQYTVTVSVALNSAKDITAFSINGNTGTISGTSISVSLIYGTSLTSLTPSFTHTGDSVSPTSGTARNFSSPVTYTVTAADGTTKQYTVTATVEAAKVDCAAHKTARPSLTDGVYYIDPDGAGSITAFQAYCDMTSNGGGWTLIGKTAAGNYSGLSDTAYIALIANPTTDVNSSYLQSASMPSSGQIAFWNKAKTNALYHASGTKRAVRITMAGNVTDTNANGTFFQQRVSAPSNWDFWHALRNSTLWNRDGSVTGDFVNYFGTDFVLGNAANFNSATNTVTHSGDTTFGAWGTVTHTLNDGSSLVVTRHMGLLCDGYNAGFQWLLTSMTSPADTRWKNDQSLQTSTIWLR